MVTCELGRKMRPNILFIVWDTVRYDHLSYNGYEKQTTLFLDSISGELTHFQNAFAPTHWTLPSHTSMFTGLYPSEHGMNGQSSGLPEQTPVLAEILKKSGYQTAAVTWNVFIDPNTGLDRGFDTFVGHTQLRDMALRKQSLPLSLLARTERLRDRLKATLKIKGWVSSLMVDVACDWVADTWQPQAPFFMFMNFMDAHFPLFPLADFKREFGAPEKSSISKRQAWENIACANTVSSTEVEGMVALYDASIAYLDFQLERLFEFLSAKKLLDDTLVIIVSDHGESFGEHGLFGHTPSVYDTVTYVPLLMRLTDAKWRGVSYQPQVEIIDLFSTILDVAQFDNIYPHHGQSLIDQLDEPDAQRYVFAERFPMGAGMYKNLLKLKPDYDISWHIQSQKSVRSLSHKYIWSDSGRHEFYDLRSDPGEESNLIDAELPEKDHLKSVLEQWIAGLNLSTAPETRVMDDEAVIMERLADLGYIE